MTPAPFLIYGKPGSFNSGVEGVRPHNILRSGALSVTRPLTPPNEMPSFLIANARLEFRATPRKQTVAAKSNRKQIAICLLDFHSLRLVSPVTHHLSLITDEPWPPRRLIETPRLESPPTPTKQSPDIISNRDKSRCLCSPPVSHQSPLTNHKSRLTTPVYSLLHDEAFSLFPVRTPALCCEPSQNYVVRGI